MRISGLFMFVLVVFGLVSNTTFAAASAAEIVASPLRAIGAGTQDAHQLEIDEVLLQQLKTAVARNARVRLGGLPLPGGLRVELDLQPIEVFTPETIIEIAGERSRTIAPPAEMVLLSGIVSGDPDSDAFLAFTPAGVEGWVYTQGVRFDISDGLGQELSVHRIRGGKGMAIEDFCACDEIPQPFFKPRLPEGDGMGGVAGGIGEGPACQRVRLAIETDQELRGLFGGDNDATIGYIATLVAAANHVYTRDLNSRLVISYLRLWETEDPWTQGEMGDQLYEFRDHWEANEQLVSRDLAHFLSGRGLGGGVAWLGVVCNTSYGYALSANLAGSFPYPVEHNSGQNWDLMVFTHELGHNFGAPHTHDLNPPVDNCAGGDCSVTPNGTIMSYCHGCPGGLENVRMEFCPENIDMVGNYFAQSGCDFTVDERTMCLNDYIETSAGIPTMIDVLQNDVAVSCVLGVLAEFDQDSTQGGVVELVENWGPDGRSALRYTSAVDFVGVDSFTYTSRRNDVLDTCQVYVDIEGLRVPEDPIGTEPGVEVSYYALDQLSVLPDFDTLTPFASEVVSFIDYPSTGGAFMGSGLSDDVGAVFHGWVHAPTAGDWTFGTNSDDGSALYIGEQLVVINDGLHAMVERTGSIGLEAGWHAMRVEFFERGGGAGLIVMAGGPDVAYDVIPAERLAHGGGTGNSPDLNGDGLVNGADLGLLLAFFGQSGAGDLDGNGTTDGGDLGIMLAAWTG